MKKSKLVERKSFRRLPLDLLVPNPWNMNRMTGLPFEKLKRGIQKLVKLGQPIPPITARPHPDDSDKWEIIDGYHRKKACQELGILKLPTFVINVDTPTAILLTNNLNYLRGEKDPKKFVEALARLHKEFEIPVLEMTEFLPEGVEELTDLLDTLDTNDAIDISAQMEKEQIDKERKEKSTEQEEWLELKFVVSKSQASVVERAITRIENELHGGNRRGRALEFIAADALNTPLSRFQAEEQEEERVEKKLKKKKKKKRDEAA